ncbi:MAG TPA: M23 family metallopeptidase [Methylomirabilota bacterium]|nr:M23 family metallopeptidase [Methylomirabilota bacterium]
MRYALALTGIVVFGAIFAGASVTRAPAVVAEAAAAAPVPLATADPAVITRVIPESIHGRLTVEDRVDRRVVRVKGLSLPIDGVALPTDPDLLPNASRDYRAGWHEGIDFPARAGTPVRAIGTGTVVRVDREYGEWDRESERIALSEAVQLGYTPEKTLDLIRGRQVWIDHGHGVVSRYAHLSAVADLAVGDVVAAGQIVGAVGSSGYPEGGPHLHLEVRVGSSYLGDGLAGDALTAAITAAFD